MKVHLMPHAIFETAKSGFIQNLHHCSVLWKITPLYFCNSNLVYFGQKEPIEKKISNFWVVRWKFIKFLMSYLKPQVSFSFNLCITLQCHERQLFCTFLAETFYDLDKRNPSKCKISDFDSSPEISPNFYFDMLLLLKVYKISAQKV